MKNFNSSEGPGRDCRDQASASAELAWAVSRGQSGELARQVDLHVRRRRSRRRRASAVAALLLGSAGLWLIHSPDTPAPLEAVASAIYPETLDLPDGTRVELRPGARLRVAFAPEGSGPRRVALEAGEAHFQVAHDAARPFLVEAAGMIVRAVGTAFAVQLEDGRLDVLVTEGRVAVEPPAPEASMPAGGAPLAFVAAGQGFRLDPAAPVPAAVPVTIPAAEQASRLAWRIPRLELSGTPLAEALPHFNRHGATPIQLADPALGRLQISGRLRADNTAALLQLLESEFGLAAERRGDVLVLRRGR